jgi:hypothetical protein
MRVDLVLDGVSLSDTERIISFNGMMKVYEVLLEILRRLRGDILLCVSSDVLVNGVSLYSYDMNAEISSLNMSSLSTVTLVTHVKPTHLRKLMIALEESEDTTKPMLAKLIRKHLKYGDIVWYS